VVPDRPSATDELRRRGVAAVTELRSLGYPEHEVDAVAGLRAAGDWLVDSTHAERLRGRLRTLLDRHARQDPLSAGLPLEQARQLLGLPDVRLVQALVGLGGGGSEDGATGLALHDGRVVRPDTGAGGLPPAVAAAVRAVRSDLLENPFLAPDALRLQQLGLDRRALGAAVRLGLLASVAPDVYLLPGWQEQATGALGSLDGPFTVAEARRALGTTRRVAVPVLERLDAEHRTVRLPDDRRVLRPT
jgi:selenocysteine-specific elongation factor